MPLATLNGTEILEVVGNISGKPCGESETTTTQAIANLGGAGGLPARIISSGTSDSASASDNFIGWNSESASPKSQAITDGNSSTVLIIKDVYGNAGTYPITITSSTWTIDGQSNFVLNGNKNSVSLKASPTTNNWMIF